VTADAVPPTTCPQPQELRSTLEDGNAVIDIVRTLRGAECDAAKFEPPTAKPARITGVSKWVRARAESR
jgi:hypothetical protein